MNFLLSWEGLAIAWFILGNIAFFAIALREGVERDSWYGYTPLYLLFILIGPEVLLGRAIVNLFDNEKTPVKKTVT